MTIDGEVYALSRLLDKKSKDVEARLGDPGKLRTVERTMAHVGGEVAANLRNHIAEAKRLASTGMKLMTGKREAMKARHQAERRDIAARQKERADRETKARASRVRGGVKGLWDIMTGRYFRVRKQNEAETVFSGLRDREERHALVSAQLAERGELQTDIKAARRGYAERVLRLYQHAAQFQRMRDGRSRDQAPELGR